MEINTYSPNDFRLYSDELYHHQRKGAKWGVRNGPPYPLKEGQLSGEQKKLGGVSESAKEKYGADATSGGSGSRKGINRQGQKPVKKLTDAQKALIDENRKYKSTIDEMKVLTGDCRRFEGLRNKDIEEGKSKEAKQAIAAADLGLRALEKLRGWNDLEGENEWYINFYMEKGLTREQAQKKADDEDREWFLFEDQTIGLPMIADLVNQGYTANQISKLVDRISYKVDDYWDETRTSDVDDKTDYAVFNVIENSMCHEGELKKFAKICEEIKNGSSSESSGSSNGRKGIISDAFNKATIEGAKGPRSRDESNAEYEERKNRLADATKSLVKDRAMKSNREFAEERNKNAEDAAKLESKINSLKRRNVLGKYDKKINELAATRDMKIKDLTKAELDFARLHFEEARNMKLAAIGGAMYGFATGGPIGAISSAALSAVGTGVINAIINDKAETKIIRQLSKDRDALFLERKQQRGEALDEYETERAKKLGVDTTRKYAPKLTDQQWDNAYESLSKKLQRVDYDGDKLNIAALTPEEQAVYYQIMAS